MATLELQNVTKSFGSTEVIHGIDVRIADGEFIVIVGPSGCGKSTLLRMVAGLETVTSGDVLIDGQNVNEKEPMDRALQETGAKIWMAGLRRSQSVGRENLNFLEQQKGVLKLYPILDWDDRKTYQYIPQNGLPYHPLEGMGYDSVGDWHSTKKISEVENVEEARHGGHGRECGLHLEVPEGTDFNV